MKKGEKTTRPFRYALNQIPYNYTGKVTDRLRGLDLTERVPEDLWMEICDFVEQTVIKTIPRKKKKAKRQNDCLRRPYK